MRLITTGPRCILVTPSTSVRAAPALDPGVQYAAGRVTQDGPDPRGHIGCGREHPDPCNVLKFQFIILSTRTLYGVRPGRKDGVAPSRVADRHSRSTRRYDSGCTIYRVSQKYHTHCRFVHQWSRRPFRTARPESRPGPRTHNVAREPAAATSG